MVGREDGERGVVRQELSCCNKADSSGLNSLVIALRHFLALLFCEFCMSFVISLGRDGDVSQAQRRSSLGLVGSFVIFSFEISWF